MNNYTKLNELILELDKSTDLIGYCSVANVCKRLERIESNKPELKSALAEFNNLTEEEKYEYVSSVLNVETDFNFPHTINGPIRIPQSEFNKLFEEINKQAIEALSNARNRQSPNRSSSRNL